MCITYQRHAHVCLISQLSISYIVSFLHDLDVKIISTSDIITYFRRDSKYLHPNVSRKKCLVSRFTDTGSMSTSLKMPPFSASTSSSEVLCRSKVTPVHMIKIKVLGDTQEYALKPKYQISWQYTKVFKKIASRAEHEVGKNT